MLVGKPHNTRIRTVKLSLCLTKHQGMKTYPALN